LEKKMDSGSQKTRDSQRKNQEGSLQKKEGKTEGKKRWVHKKRA